MSIFKTQFDANRQTVLVKEKTVYELQNLSSPKLITDAMNDLFNLQNQTEEYLYCLCFDVKCRLIGIFEVSHGTVCGTIVDNRTIFQKSLMLGAVNIALVHNHPSGDPAPSMEDRIQTNAINQGAKLVGLSLLDHIVIGLNNYYSFQECGYI